MNYRSVANLSVKDIETIETIAGDMLAYYGYQRSPVLERKEGDGAVGIADSDTCAE
jgi:hypothetical protein